MPAAHRWRRRSRRGIFDRFHRSVRPERSRGTCLDFARHERIWVRSCELKRMDLLRFITCGSVDDGKSTLIGRLLHDCGALFDDQLGDGEPDFAALLDGLSAEREQGITIDVAYRYFASANRSFIVAD